MAIGRIPEPGTGIPESIIAAKGDLIVGTANDTPGILSVGTNGHTLVADSSVSPTGLKWAAPASISWTTWSPSYTNLTIGNGTVVARYAYSGGLVILQWQLTWGSTSSFPGGSVSIGSLPYNPKNRGAAIGYLQAGNVNRPFFMNWSANSSVLYPAAITTDGTYAGRTDFTSTIPGTWASGPEDFIAFYAVYEAN